MPTTTKYIWDEDNLLAEADGSDTIHTVYTNEPQQYGNLISSRISGTTSCHHFDALGSTRQLTNAVGGTTDTMIYDAWGNVVSRTGTTGANHLWVGERGYYLDVELSSFHVGQRTYTSSYARWMSPDPLPMRAPSELYGYCRNRPIAFIDPSGLIEIDTSQFQQWNWTINEEQCRIELGLCVDLIVNKDVAGALVPIGNVTEFIKQSLQAAVEGCWNNQPFRMYGRGVCPGCPCPCRGFGPSISVGFSPKCGAANSTIRIGGHVAAPTRASTDIRARTIFRLDIVDLFPIINTVPNYGALRPLFPDSLLGMTFPIPREYWGRNFRQTIVCHELGHLLGFRGHAGSGMPTTAVWRSILQALGFPREFWEFLEYDVDAPGLMGSGSEFRPEYFSHFAAELSDKYAQCGPFRAQTDSPCLGDFPDAQIEGGSSFG